MTRAALLAALAPALLLGGCAAALIPVVAGGIAGKKVADSRGDADGGGAEEASERAEQTAGITAVAPEPSPAAATTASEAELDAEPDVGIPDPGADEVPLVARTVTGEPYADFVAYALGQARRGPGSRTPRSVMVEKFIPATGPQFHSCSALAPAVLIDLDPAGVLFDPAAEGTYSAPLGLGAGLAELRGAGLTILWVSGAPLDHSEAIYEALREAGLDPEGTDRLLLPRRDDERKQTRRADAAKNWCVVAIAGDRRADFDELFDYLIDPDAKTGLEPLFGQGWYLVPTPLS